MAKQVSEVLSHWYKLFEDFQYPTLDFYKQVETAIKSRNVSNLKISRVSYQEGGLLTAKREYLRIQRKDHLFDLCAAPFGKGFFISWWLGSAPGFLMSLVTLIPIIGGFFSWFVRPMTYYQIDTALMFQGSVHTAVLEVIDGLVKTNGLRALSESDRKPILRELYQK